jgi:hypothetical protein
MKARKRHLCLLVAFAALAAACGDADQSAKSGDGDAAPGSDAASDMDASLDDGGPGASCGRELASFEDAFPAAVVVDDTYLYVLDVPLDARPVRIWRVHRERGGAELLTTVERGRDDIFVGDGNALYVSTGGRDLDGSALYRIDTSEPDQLELVAEDSVESVVVDETHVYWSTVNPGPDAIKRRSKAGGDEETLVQDGDLEDPTNIRLAIVGDQLYWSNGVSLMRTPRAGGSSAVHGMLAAAGSGTFAERLVAGADDRLYWFSDAEEKQRFRFYRTAADVFERELLVSEPAEYISSQLFVADDQLYWAIPYALEAGQGSGIRRAPAAGGPLVNLDRSSWPFVPTPAGIYVANYERAEIIPLAGCPE